MPAIQSPGSTQNGCRCHEILNEGRQRLFQSTTDIYIYIYMKVDKGAVKIKFCYPMLANEGKL